jgi:hypothetical protein
MKCEIYHGHKLNSTQFSCTISVELKKLYDRVFNLSVGIND